MVYKHAGLSSMFVDLNYTNLKVYSKGTWPDTLFCRKLDPVGEYHLEKLEVIDANDIWETADEAECIRNIGRGIWGVKYGVLQSLLLVSRQIHKEVEAFTYASAVFRVCMGQPLGLQGLWRMSDFALSNLCSLTVRLDLPKDNVQTSGWNEPLQYLSVVDSSTREGKAIVRDWTNTMIRLSSIVRPQQLRLRVIFRARKIDDAQAIIKPMLRLPRLKDCGICAELEGSRRWWTVKLVNMICTCSEPSTDKVEERLQIRQTLRGISAHRKRHGHSPTRRHCHNVTYK